MIIDNDPPITRYISIPKDMDQLSCSALTAGIVEAVLDGLGFVSNLTPPALARALKITCVAGSRHRSFSAYAQSPPPDVNIDQIRPVCT